MAVNVLCHRSNIPLSATSTSALVDASSHTPYLPPHPQQGTNYHRYTTLLLPQSEEISLPAFSKEERFNFDVREFVEQYGLDGTKGGAHMFREVWDSDVSNIYSDILGELLLNLYKKSRLMFFRLGGAQVWETQEARSVCWTCAKICFVDLIYCYPNIIIAN